MSGFDDDRTSSGSTSVVWSVAALSVAVFMCSVLGAKLLAQMIDRGELASLASDRSLRQLAASAPAPQAPQVYSIVRSIGVDGMTTATIPHQGSAPLSPCGETAAGPKLKK
jgi:hypothetical protein